MVSAPDRDPVPAQLTEVRARRAGLGSDRDVGFPPHPVSEVDTTLEGGEA